MAAFAPSARATPVPSTGVISASGEYILTADRVSTGMFNIKIEADDVTLDLGGHTVRCQPADPATATTFGIHAAALAGPLTVMNGKITGCMFGLHAADTPNVTVDGVDFSGNTYVGASLGGSGNVIRGCTFVAITGYNLEAYAIGINAPGSNCLIEDNHFGELYRQPGAVPDQTGEGVAILVTDGQTGCTIHNNVIENAAQDGRPNIGIWVGTGSAATISKNTITGFPIGMTGYGTATIADNVLQLPESDAGSFAIGINNGVASGNRAVGYKAFIYEHPKVRVIDAGGNEVVP